MSKALLLTACIMVGDGGGQNTDVSEELVLGITGVVYHHLMQEYVISAEKAGNWCVYDAADSFFWHHPTDNVADMLSAWAADYGIVWPRGPKPSDVRRK